MRSESCFFHVEMPISTDIISLLYVLLPGFVTMWVFHGMTAHRRKGIFGQTAQALIFTILVQGVVTAVRLIPLKASVVSQLPQDERRLLAAVIVALFLGITFAGLSNWDLPHILFRKIKLTSRTTAPSEWYYAFSRHTRSYVILHLSDDRRITGFPLQWPDHPQKGHFELEHAAWLKENNEAIELGGAESILIPADKVDIVEFLVTPVPRFWHMNLFARLVGWVRRLLPGEDSWAQNKFKRIRTRRSTSRKG